MYEFLLVCNLFYSLFSFPSLSLSEKLFSLFFFNFFFFKLKANFLSCLKYLLNMYLCMYLYVHIYYDKEDILIYYLIVMLFLGGWIGLGWEGGFPDWSVKYDMYCIVLCSVQYNTRTSTST